MKHTVGTSTIIGLLFTGYICFSQQFPTGFAPQQLIENLDPTDLVVTHDDRIFITIKSGKILVVEDEQLTSGVFLNIESQVDNFNERGLGHMVLDPDFETNYYYYIYYTVKDTNRNRISRFTANGNSTLPGSEVVLLDLEAMAGSIHNGGDMAFGPDGKLFVSTGDGANSATAQSKSSLLGKILRMNQDGTVPADNPFFNDVSYTGINKLIYALGFRNPFSMDIQPGTGKIFACDVGNSEWEEVNDVQAGRNYGWPLIEGMRTTQAEPENYQDPLYTYNHDDGCSIVGASFYNPEHDQFPAEYVGKFFFADYCGGYIKYTDPANGSVQPFATGIDRPLAITVNHEGTLYYLQRSGIGGGSTGDNTSSPDGSLWKVAYTGSGGPFVGNQPQSILVSVGEDASFLVSASGAPTLSYQWQVDGADISGANSSAYVFQNAQLTDDGKLFRCIISNSIGQATSNEAMLSVTTNTRPVPVITTPADGTLYRAGEIISFSGAATDAEDGTVPASQLTWSIDFHHDEHSHPALQSTNGISSGNYNVPRIGETDDNVWYRIYFTGTDNQGFSKTIYKDVFPEKTTIQLTTIPVGLQINVDGQPVQTPATITSVIGITRSLEAPVSQYAGNDFYVYSAWSDNSLPQIFSFNVAPVGQSYTAQFTLVPVGEGEGLSGKYYNQSRTFNGTPDLIRTDDTINFDWEQDSPATGTINDDNFTARWEGFILPQFTDTYTFYTISDDGVTLWINHQLIIDQWIPQAPTEWSGSISLQAGVQYPVVIEYFEDGGGAVMKLSWKSTLLPKQIVPQSQLFESLITDLDNPLLERTTLYPTVADSKITVQTAYGETIRWIITNTLGQVLKTGNHSERAFEINLENFSPGIYFFRVTGRKSEVIRFIKK